MFRSQALTVGVLLILVLLLSGCYVAPDGSLVYVTPAPAGETTDESAESTTEEIIEPTEPITLTATVNTRSLRVRQAPDTESPIVAGLREGTTVTVVARNDDIQWLQIEVPDVETLGWVAAEYLIVDGDPTGLPVPGTEEESAVAEAVATDTPVPTPAPTATEAAKATPQIDLVQTAAATDEFSVLTQALAVADLVSTLRGEGPFTVFAPTDDAFAALPEGALDALLADPEGALRTILLHHVVTDNLAAADLSDGQELESAAGEALMIGVTGNVVTVDGANVTLTDLVASNGVIHVIDTVLIPSTVDVEALVAAPAAPAVEATATVTATVVPTVTPTAEMTPTAVPTTGSAAIFLSPTNTLAQVNTRSLRVRAAPDADAEVVWGVRNGEFYAVIDQTPDGAWVALAVPELGGAGWVATEFLILSQDLQILPVMGSATVITTDGARLRVRNAPSTEGELQDALLEGEQYEVVATTADGLWTLLNLPDVVGPNWVASEFIELSAPQR